MVKRWKEWIGILLAVAVVVLVLLPVQQAKLPLATARSGDCAGMGATTTHGPKTVTAQHTGFTAPHIAFFRAYQTVRWTTCHTGLYSYAIGSVNWSNDFWVNGCSGCLLDGWHIVQWFSPIITSGVTTDQYGGTHHWMKRERKAEWESCPVKVGCVYMYTDEWQKINSEGGYSEWRNMS